MTVAVNLTSVYRPLQQFERGVLVAVGPTALVDDDFLRVGIAAVVVFAAVLPVAVAVDASDRAQNLPGRKTTTAPDDDGGCQSPLVLLAVTMMMLVYYKKNLVIHSCQRIRISWPLREDAAAETMTAETVPRTR